MKQVCCRGCREWFDAALAACPDCERVRPGYNSWLVTAELNNHLYKQMEETQPKNEYRREYTRYKKYLDELARDL